MKECSSKRIQIQTFISRLTPSDRRCSKRKLEVALITLAKEAKEGRQRGRIKQRFRVSRSWWERKGGPPVGSTPAEQTARRDNYAGGPESKGAFSAGDAASCSVHEPERREQRLKGKTKEDEGRRNVGPRGRSEKIARREREKPRRKKQNGAKPRDETKKVKGAEKQSNETKTMLAGEERKRKSGGRRRNEAQELRPPGAPSVTVGAPAPVHS